MSHPTAGRGEIARSVTRGAFYLGIEKGAALVSGIVYFALLLRWLGPTKYGIITLALSFVGLATVATGNFEVYLERYATEHETHGRMRTLRRAHHLTLALKLGLGLIATAVLLALAPALARSYGTPELMRLLPLLALIVVCDGLSTTGRAMLYGFQRFRWIGVIGVIFHVAKTIMVGALWWTRRGLPELALGLAVLTALQGVVLTAIPMWMMRRARDDRTAPADERGLVRSVMSYCMPLLGARVAFLSGQNLSKVVLGKLFDTTLLGYFSFAFQTVERFVELAFTLPSALLPPLTQLVARGERERLRAVFDRTFGLVQTVAAAVAFTLFVFAPELTRWVGSPLFTPAVPLLRILALVPFARTAQQPLTMLFQALRLPGIVFALALVKFAFEFGCYFTLVPWLGLAGAGWANLIGAVAAFAAAQLALRTVLAGGAAERARTTLRTLALLAPFLGAGLLLDLALRPVPAFAAKLVLVPAALVLAFAFGLVTRADLETAAALPLSAAWMRRARDAAVAAGDRLARVVAVRRAL
ncbi:MAG: lipopolysaccharide biosynthesis protein [Candidatus Eisenbacteria bacterium]|uniref:Lipopolysaccharide biosynthesis protein n=1 Tax=Eiseniibacteriota bacterium TaxID=2212470 RepID=A0A9D6LBS6_UNCEI|nr:lipopolysaccharide biosynthesis protein [Candidatus Eisenbacteria bacterium]MBI3540243.1 lipopolysaccharide biosynthesis protein [Candidatus Eisenbacteria bacterium]